MITPNNIRLVADILNDGLCNRTWESDDPEDDNDGLDEALRYAIQMLNQRAKALEETKDMNQGGVWPSVK